MNVTSTDAKVSQLSEGDVQEIDGIVEYWKKSFLQLKTFDMEVVCKALVDKGVDAQNKLVYQGRVVFDAPKYYYEIKIADSNRGTFGTQTAFDGHYYWRQTMDKSGPGSIERSVKSFFIPTDLNPLLAQYSFVFGINSIQTFSAFYASKTWGSFRDHAIKVGKPAPGSKDRLIFQVKNEEKLELFHETITELYTVNIASDDTPYPSSWEQISTKSPGIKIAFIVSGTKRYSQDTLQFSFPIRVHSLIYLKNTLMTDYEINVPVDKLKINQPIDSTIFTLKPDKDTRVIDRDLYNGL